MSFSDHITYQRSQSLTAGNYRFKIVSFSLLATAAFILTPCVLCRATYVQLTHNDKVIALKLKESAK